MYRCMLLHVYILQCTNVCRSNLSDYLTLMALCTGTVHVYMYYTPHTAYNVLGLHHGHVHIYITIIP